jgi:predicted nuclease with TOPRIM domain
MDNKSETNSREEIIKLEGLLAVSYESLSGKIKALLDKYRNTNEENHLLKENIKEINNKVTDLKLQLNKLNSDTLLKDREISELKTLLLSSENENTNVRDKDFVKSRLKELISRIDVHLETYEDQSQDFED